jgi:hypothetical protein
MYNLPLYFISSNVGFITKLRLMTTYWVILVALASCAMQKIPAGQGIEGFVYQASGNQMPMKGRPVSAKSKGITREIWIYEATPLQQAEGRLPLFNRINTRLISKTRSDSTGHYQVNVPAGRYSVLVKEGQQFFAAETNGIGTLTPVEVLHGKMSRRDVIVNLQASY